MAHSCDATPIEYNVTLKMGLHSGVFQKVGRVDSMDDCIEMSCKEPRSDVAFMLGSMCYAVHCYSADLCKTVPIFGSSISRLNLNPAISFLKKNSQFGISSLGKFMQVTILQFMHRPSSRYQLMIRLLTFVCLLNMGMSANLWHT